MMNKLVAVLALFAGIASDATAQSLESWTVTQTGPTEVAITLSGIWPSGCVPQTVQTTRIGFAVTILLPAVPVPGACTAVLTPFSVSVTVAGLDPGDYNAQVRANHSVTNTPIFGNFAFSVNGTFVIPVLTRPMLSLLASLLLLAALFSRRQLSAALALRNRARRSPP
ncbi:MAG TPA: hypothetical protein VNG69_04560 [Casimicrobiaceae bacterium]|nr:hypothetical protein [Casimicrobiaceae bacterium]